MYIPWSAEVIVFIEVQIHPGGSWTGAMQNKGDEGKKKLLGNEATMGDDVTRCWRLIQIKFCLRQEVFVTLAKIF